MPGWVQGGGGGRASRQNARAPPGPGASPSGRSFKASRTGPLTSDLRWYTTPHFHRCPLPRLCGNEPIRPVSGFRCFFLAPLCVAVSVLLVSEGLCGPLLIARNSVESLPACSSRPVQKDRTSRSQRFIAPARLPEKRAVTVPGADDRATRLQQVIDLFAHLWDHQKPPFRRLFP